MKSSGLYITLKHLWINEQRCIGIQFYPNKLIQALVKELPSPKWSVRYQMVFILNTPSNVNAIFDKFRGVAWVNCSHFFPKSTLFYENKPLSWDWFYNRELKKGYRACPNEYIQKLEIKRYALNTAKIYIMCFERFINHYKTYELMQIDEDMIHAYLQQLVKKQKSRSYLNQTINAIKFYYEVVKEMPNRFYKIDRPRKADKLPTVLAKDEINQMLACSGNLKNRCIIGLLYSAGLRRSELLQLKLQDIDSKRMLIRVEGSKGEKDRYTLLSEKLLIDLRRYYKFWKPKTYLFEGPDGRKYGVTSVGKIVKRAAERAKISKNVTPHMLRHSFATHLLESGTDLRYIQALLGHSSTRTTEIYTRVAVNKITKIENPLDSII
ncbi:tyrosine-type recombinase/integrase [Sediminitomix flava]|uniref:Site-specific recombinase XerD n=1 Tax=Sediminitomix flava TaxID=379075 RepID=A0A315YY29_SEDFL|nr:tyrosine-type recombinase/integrase [Sediminitomix flava]PWJ35048.1 site-specific recombinase XerD [Sediminitomix flava]